MFRQFLLTRATDFCPLYTAENVSFWRNNIYINILDSEFGACLHFRIIIVFKISCETFEPSLSVSVTDAAAAAVIAVMLNEDKFSRPRPRTNRRGRGRGRGQNHEAEAEANFPRPKITFNIIMFTTRTVQYINVSSLLSFVIIIINHSSSHNV